MNLLNNTLVVAEIYHSTELGERWEDTALSILLFSLSIILTVLVGLAIIVTVMLGYEEKIPPKLAKKLRIAQLKKKIIDDPNQGNFTNMDIITSVMVILMMGTFILGATSLAAKDDNLVKNIQQKYAIDDIEWSESNGIYHPEKTLEATVTKGGKTYEITITQNLSTHEPTLFLTSDVTTEATELLR